MQVENGKLDESLGRKASSLRDFILLIVGLPKLVRHKTPSFSETEQGFCHYIFSMCFFNFYEHRHSCCFRGKLI